MITNVPIDIITCPEWDAHPPNGTIQLCPKSVRILIHHTAGHHPEISLPKDESEEEAIRYARDIQHSHMSPSPTDPSKPWIDSGHNFLVCRNGSILQGRWHTVWAIQHQKMVLSAHCPGQNTQIGIEHEHLGTEAMTKKQRNSSARLIAWIAGQYGRKTVLPLAPHSKYFATACPANLKAEIPKIRNLANQILVGEL